MASARRVKTGVPGLDEILGGGIPVGSTVLVTGPAGAGKTILSSQFAFMGASKYKEPAVYLSLEEGPDSIKANCLNFGWDLGALENRDKITFAKYDRYHMDDIPNILEDKIRDTGARRAVIDSITALNLYMRDASDFRRMLLKLSRELGKLECTTLLVAEVPPGSQALSKQGVAEFISDGILALHYSRLYSAFQRALHVWKMRGSEHSLNIHPFDITRRGIMVHPTKKAHLE